MTPAMNSAVPYLKSNSYKVQKMNSSVSAVKDGEVVGLLDDGVSAVVSTGNTTVEVINVGEKEFKRLEELIKACN
jgi:hypothetical protein